MLSPADFAARWGKGEAPLGRFPWKAVDRLAISEEDKDFLLRAGLPEDASPFLAFEAPKSGELPTVSDVFDLPDELRRYRVIGFDGSGSAIAIDEKHRGEVVCLDHDNGMARVLLNSSIRQLAASLLAYRKMVRATMTRNGPDAFLDGNIPPDALKELQRELHQIDAAALKSGAFWANQVRSLEANAV